MSIQLSSPVIAAPDSAKPLLNNSPAAAIPTDVATAAKIPPTQTPASPSVSVTLSPAARELQKNLNDAATSTTTMTFLRTATTAADGAASAQMSQTLATELNLVSDKKTVFRASSIFSQLGALSAETNFYHNQARHFQVPDTVAAEKFSPDFDSGTGRRQESVTLNIRTSEGDSVAINFVRQGGESLELSFTVDGELSEKEQQALDQLAKKLGEVADEFFRTGTAELRGLSELDDESIGSFKLSLSKPRGDDYDTLSYDYSVNQETQTRSLTGTDSAGYEFDITAQFQGLLNRASSASAQTLEQYLDLIRDAGDQHKAESSSVRFMLDGLRSMLSPKALEQETVEQDATETALAKFDSGLPDFTAHFSAPMVHNRENYAQVAALRLSVGQQTKVEVEADRFLVQQESSYQLHESHFEKLAGIGKPGFSGQNYRYITEHISETTTRTLDMKADAVSDVFVQQDYQRQYTDRSYQGIHLLDTREENEADHQLRNLMDALHQQNNAQMQQQNILAMLENSRRELFYF